MRSVILFLAIAATSSVTVSGQAPYNLASVPEPVKNKAAIITHLYNTELEVESPDKARLSIHRIFTVVSKDGDDALVFNEYSSRDISLEDVEIRVFDANGKQTGKYKKKDMNTVATGEGLIEDGYVTYYPIRAPSYPVTVEVKYEQVFKSTLNIPAFRFIHPKEGVIEASYTARVLPEVGLRYLNKNTSIEPVITDEGKFKVYKWTVKNLSPVEYEEGSVAAIDRYPHVTFAPEKFSHYGFKGELSSWNSFGAWIKNLYEGLDILPAERQQFFQQLVKDAPADKEKIRRIYRYMQDNFRYVSIQLGIGGLKPFSADFTDKKKYGDCKALSNYMKAALRSVGIPSHVAIINAGHNQEPVDAAFPANEFNHVILCVPGQADSVWLECTSATAGFGELGTFTENRNALLITDNGGVLVSTPKSNPGANSLSMVTTIDFKEDLSGLIETAFTASGAYKDLMREILKEKRDRQKEALVFYFGARQPDDFIMSDPAPGDVYKTTLKMVVLKMPEFNAGNKLFMAPRIYKMWQAKLPKTDNRKYDYYFQYPFERHDTTIFRLPAGVKPDALPAGKELACDYAVYRSGYWYNEKENAVYSATSLVLKTHKIPAAGFAGLKKFYEEMLQDDVQRLVVNKPEAPKKAF
ncbi:MAG: DUF3857 domain-containing protein [Chitinophagaceae bacterium]|nr:DUF3857 domain-containing protein [Chitinophagaceae bacterium]